jgi:type II secretory pathway component GspD/PulD (secretin)
MNWRCRLGLLAVLAASPAFAQTPSSAARQTPPPAQAGQSATTYRLRNVAAADAAQAITAQLAREKASAAVVAEPVSNTLLLSGKPAGVRRAVALLAALDREPASVVVQVMCVRVPVGVCERIGLKPTGNADEALNDRELRQVMAELQEVSECTVMMAPKLTVADGQVASVRATERRYFVTGLEAVNVNGTVTLVPQNKPVDLGPTMTVCARVSADEKAVTLRMNLTHSRLVGEVEMIPVTTQIKPVFEGGSQGKPVPLTQFLQAPRVQTSAVECDVIVPSGKTVVLGGWKEPAADAAVSPTPFSRVRYVNRMFKTATPAPACEYEVVVLATVQVIRVEDEAPAPPQTCDRPK